MKRIIDKHLSILADEIITHYKSKGMLASGQFGKTMYVEVNDNSGVMYAEDYVEQLEEGRKPGKFPQFDKIEQWIKDKRLAYDIPLRSLVFLIARKISKKGWKRQGYGGVNLITEVLTDERLEKLYNDIASEYFEKQTKQLELEFKLW